jgi:tetratricopeptide (TPR) repeat protein
MLYKLLEVRLLMKEGNFSAAGESLKAIEPSITEASNEVKYYFYYNMGSLLVYGKDFEEALRFYLLANGIGADGFEKEVALHFNIAICYSNLGKYLLAITSMEGIYHLFNHADRTSIPGMLLDNNLSVDYMRIGNIKKARKFIDKTLIRAKSINNRHYIGAALHNHGCACFRSGEFEKAIEYFDEAFDYFRKGSDVYLENLYFQIRSLIALKSSKAKKALHDAKSISENNEHYTILFKSLTHLLTMRENASLQYIEKTTIPHLLEKHEYFRALNYCKELEIAYEKKSSKMKSLEMKALAYDIHLKIINGSDE